MSFCVYVLWIITTIFNDYLYKYITSFRVGVDYYTVFYLELDKLVSVSHFREQEFLI